MEELIELLKFKCVTCFAYTDHLINDMCVSCNCRHWEWKIKSK